MAEMIVKCLSCNLQSLAVKTDPSCDPTVISFLEMNFNRYSFLTSDGLRRKKQMFPPEIH